MVYRIYAEKKKELAQEAAALLAEIQGFLGIPAATEVRILNRYDVENITPERFEEAVRTVFSEPQVDNVYTELPDFDGAVFAVEPLPGQFDQRSDSAEQCIQLMSGGERPLVRAAKVLPCDLAAQVVAWTAASCACGTADRPARLLEVGQGRATKTILMAGAAQSWSRTLDICSVELEESKVRLACERLRAAAVADRCKSFALDATSLSDDDMPMPLQEPFDVVDRAALAVRQLRGDIDVLAQAVALHDLAERLLASAV